MTTRALRAERFASVVGCDLVLLLNLISHLLITSRDCGTPTQCSVALSSYRMHSVPRPTPTDVSAGNGTSAG